nr:hypothetical protein [Oscillatoria sp. FACHB-1406]
MRLTRDETKSSATDSKQYEEFGKKVHQQLAYTYFYPAIKSENPDYEIAFSWQDENLFRRRFLSSYTSTALVYPQQAADEGLLHEVEFISPRTLDEGKQVDLIGYVFEKEGCNLKWKDACKRLQMGGERGYGWGDVQLKCIDKKDSKDKQLFNASYHWEEQGDRIMIKVLESANILAHTIAENVAAKGEIEPLVGREWRSHNSTNNHAGQHVEYFGLCWTPGSIVERSLDFAIGNFGIWHLPE